MFQNIDPKTLPENVFSLIGDRWMLVTAGTPAVTSIHQIGRAHV